MQEKNVETVRINKYLAMCSVCSRRDADVLIAEGRVTVNGRTAQPGDRVGSKDTVLVNGKAVRAENKKVVLAYYKPLGVVCTEKDAHAEKKLTDMIQYPIRVTYAGRLDKDSEGLLLLSNDGELIQRMMKGSGSHEKEYIAHVDREVTDLFLHKMAQGVHLQELDITTKPCEITRIGKFSFRIILTQGVNRQIRRMCREFGYHVRSLKRVRVLNITLDSLKSGEYRELTEKELALLYKQCGMRQA